MSFRRDNGDFLKDNWDKLVALGGISVLALVAVYKIVLGGEEVIAGSQFAAARVETGTDTKVPGIEAYLENPPSEVKLDAVRDEAGSFLASEGRKTCFSPDNNALGCGRLVPSSSQACPYCGMKQTKEIKLIVDTDGDGLLDEYEKTYGLDVEKDDALADKDGDGFTNMEEFVAKTNPADAASHPDYMDSLALAGPLQQEFSTLQFVAATPYNGDYRYQFKLPSRLREVDRGVLWGLKDEEISNNKKDPKEHYKAGFIVVKYEEKKKVVPTAWGMPKREDVSEITLRRVSDGKLIKFVKDRKRTPTDVQAVLSCTRAGIQEIKVIEGQTFRIKEAEYVVAKIYSKGDEGSRESVRVRNLKTNQERVVEVEGS